MYLAEPDPRHHDRDRAHVPLADIGPAHGGESDRRRGPALRPRRSRGKVVLVSFVFTTLQRHLPADLRRDGAMPRRPEKPRVCGGRRSSSSRSRSTPSTTRPSPEDYADIYRANPNSWHFLTGPPGRCDRVDRAWGMWAKRTGGRARSPVAPSSCRPEGPPAPRSTASNSSRPRPWSRTFGASSTRRRCAQTPAGRCIGARHDADPARSARRDRPCPPPATSARASCS